MKSRISAFSSTIAVASLWGADFEDIDLVSALGVCAGKPLDSEVTLRIPAPFKNCLRSVMMGLN
jgi:hypothetical protein